MNNREFQKFVQDRAPSASNNKKKKGDPPKHKSTREIARTAVEAEFQKKAGRGRRRNNGSYESSDEEDTRSKKRSRKTDEQYHDLVPSSLGKAKGGPSNQDAPNRSKYRDRAKERREGTNAVEPSFEDEFLEEAFADSATQQTDQNSTVAPTQDQTEQSASSHFCQTLVEAQQFLQTYQQQQQLPQQQHDSARSASIHEKQPIRIRSELGHEMLEYLRFCHGSTNHKDKTTAEAMGVSSSLHRTVLTFTTRAHPGDVTRAWELPREEVVLRGDDGSNLFQKACPLPSQLIGRIEQVLDGNRNRTLRGETTKPTNETTSGQNQKDSVTNKQPQEEPNSDDDDIFADLEDYDPLAESNKTDSISAANRNDSQTAAVVDVKSTTATTGKIEKQSFFDVDRKIPAPGTTATTSSSAVGNEQKSKGADSMDQEDQSELATGTKPTRLQRLSSLSYEMDTMDADFSGQYEADEDEEGKKKNKKGKKTKRGSTTDDD